MEGCQNILPRLRLSDPLARVMVFVKPADVPQELCVQEVTGLTCEVQRLGRIKVTPIRAATRRLLPGALRPIIYSDRQPGSTSEDYPNERALAAGWTAGGRKAVERVTKLLGSFGSSVESVVTQAMASRMDAIESIDHVIVMAEQRRALRAIEGRRAQPAAEPRGVASGMEQDVARRRAGRWRRTAPRRSKLQLDRGPRHEDDRLSSRARESGHECAATAAEWERAAVAGRSTVFVNPVMSDCSTFGFLAARARPQPLYGGAPFRSRQLARW